MALEQLTPHLSRQKYREGYMKFLRDEQANEAMNLGANIQYQTTGETLQSLQSQSSTLSGMQKETLIAVLTARFTGYVQGIRGALMQLPSGQLNFAYVASDLVKEEIVAKFGEDLKQRGGVPASVFRTIVEGLYKGSNIPSQVRYPIPPESANSQVQSGFNTNNANIDTTQQQYFSAAEGTSDSAGDQLDDGLQGSDTDPNIFNVVGDNQPTVIVPSLTGSFALIAFAQSTVVLYTTPEQRQYFYKKIMDQVAKYQGYRNFAEMLMVQMIMYANKLFPWFNLTKETILRYALYIGVLSDKVDWYAEFYMKGRALFGGPMFNNAIKQLFTTTIQVLNYGAQLLQSQGITIQAALNFGEKAAQELVTMAFSQNPEAILNEVVTMANYAAETLMDPSNKLYVASAVAVGQVAYSYYADPQAFYDTVKSIVYDIPNKYLKYIMDGYPFIKKNPQRIEDGQSTTTQKGESTTKPRGAQFTEVDSGYPEAVYDTSEGPLTSNVNEGWADEDVTNLDAKTQDLKFKEDLISGQQKIDWDIPSPVAWGPQYKGMVLNPITQQSQPIRGLTDYLGIGSGIKEKKNAYISEKSVPKRKEEFRRFGKHLINVSQLERNTVCLRSKGGWKIKGTPNKIVGGAVAGILKSMVDNKSPNHEDVLKLTDDEKDYLNKLTANAAVDGFNVPTQKKTDEEKLKHEFEKTRGIIAAGNDNPDLIKQFKRMLVQLIHNKQINKSQASDVLMELHLLGH